MSAAPGPYRVTPDGKIVDQRDEDIAYVFEVPGDAISDTAALLAASWSMREALRAVLEQADSEACEYEECPPNCYLGLVAAALARTDGEVAS